MSYRYFNFDAMDWLLSAKISTMTPAQEGVYIRFLAIQWTNSDCSIPAEENTLKHLSRLGKAWANAKDTILACFPVDPTDPAKRRNKRLYLEWLAIVARDKKRTERARTAAQARWNAVHEAEETEMLDACKTHAVSMQDACLDDANAMLGDASFSIQSKTIQDNTNQNNNPESAADAAPVVSRKPRSKKPPFSMTDTTPEFREFFAHMPNQEDPATAWANWQTLLKKVDVTPADLIQAAKNYEGDCKARGQTEKFYKASNFVGRLAYYQNYLPGVYNIFVKKQCVLTEEERARMAQYM